MFRRFLLSCFLIALADYGDYLNTLAVRNKDAGKEHLEYG